MRKIARSFSGAAGAGDHRVSSNRIGSSQIEATWPHPLMSMLSRLPPTHCGPVIHTRVNFTYDVIPAGTR
jgi:hypothetical protein